MKRDRYTAQGLSEMPTISVSQFDDLKIETPTMRVWLSRMTVRDEAKYKHQVTIEVMRDGLWVKRTQYNGGVIV